MDKPPLGRQIRRARARLGNRLGRRVSQEDLALMVGVTRSAINAYENDRSVPDKYILAALEEALDEDLSNVSPPPVAHLQRLIDALTPEERARLLAQLKEENPPPPPQVHFVSPEAGRHRRAG